MNDADANFQICPIIQRKLEDKELTEVFFSHRNFFM